MAADACSRGKVARSPRAPAATSNRSKPGARRVRTDCIAAALRGWATRAPLGSACLRRDAQRMASLRGALFSVAIVLIVDVRRPMRAATQTFSCVVGACLGKFRPTLGDRGVTTRTPEQRKIYAPAEGANGCRCGSRV